MSNYRRFSPYRQHYRSGSQSFRYVGWIVVAIIIILLVKNVFLNGSGTTSDTNGDGVSLATNDNANTGAASTPKLSGEELSTKECPRAISRASVDGHYVALTVDGGGIIGDAGKVLEALSAKKVPATMFATGKWADDNAALVKSYHDAGFDVFSHSYSHPSFKGLAVDKIDAELEKADTAIKAATGASTKPYFRPPFGDTDSASIAESRSQGYCTILWTVDSQDWKTGITVDEAKTRVLDKLVDGAIIVIQANSDIGPDLVGPLVDEVQAKGYTFVTLRDLLRGTTSSSVGTSDTVESTNVNAKPVNTNTSTNKNVNAAKNTNASNANTNAAANKNS